MMSFQEKEQVFFLSKREQVEQIQKLQRSLQDMHIPFKKEALSHLTDNTGLQWDLESHGFSHEHDSFTLSAEINHPLVVRSEIQVEFSGFTWGVGLHIRMRRKSSLSDPLDFNRALGGKNHPLDNLQWDNWKWHAKATTLSDVVAFLKEELEAFLLHYDNLCAKDTRWKWSPSLHYGKLPAVKGVPTDQEGRFRHPETGMPYIAVPKGPKWKLRPDFKDPAWTDHIVQILKEAGVTFTYQDTPYGWLCSLEQRGYPVEWLFSDREEMNTACLIIASEAYWL